MPRSRPLEERFWEKVSKQPGDGCWEWTAYRCSEGYGRVAVGGKSRLAHRVAWLLEHEKWPRPFPEYTLDHLCRNPSCVRPDHLEDVTNNENVARGEGTQAAVLRTGKCRKGHDDWYMTPSGTRQCRVCRRERQAFYRTNDPEYREKNRAAARAWRARKKAEKESAA